FVVEGGVACTDASHMTCHVRVSSWIHRVSTHRAWGGSAVPPPRSTVVDSRPIVADGNNRPSSSYLRPFIFWRYWLQCGSRSSAGGWGMFPTGFPLASSFPWRRLLY
ncbi:unnamed protein product, partial [Ectocarpus sp. 8 AP-2014]